MKRTSFSRTISLLLRKRRGTTAKELQEIKQRTGFKTPESNDSPNTDNKNGDVSYRDFIPTPNDRRRRTVYDPQERMIAVLGELSKIEEGEVGQRTDSLKHLSYPELKREFMKMEKEFIYQRYCN